ncbi:unnamed protein product [Caenorhabditis angaria]|uniref:Nematode Specific Peptide family, group B n=1 Tax=Caenorhabditis angaria TaxID=860376 RepID=A0A9P1MSE5_9PELO|nr:unnamed protein product [Caenorhabditis angaria]CAI5438097.1 unnamed protein product [Caenorhabditis angaria]
MFAKIATLLVIIFSAFYFGSSDAQIVYPSLAYPTYASYASSYYPSYYSGYVSAAAPGYAYAWGSNKAKTDSSSFAAETSPSGLTNNN